LREQPKLRQLSRTDVEIGIMDKRAAEQIIPMLMRAASEVAATIEIYKAHAPEQQVKPYADAVKKVIFAIDDVFRPIINEHPDLHP
jgi:hypothetical protein